MNSYQAKQLQAAYELRDTKSFYTLLDLFTERTALKDISFKEFVESLNSKYSQSYGYTDLISKIEEDNYKIVISHRRSGTTTYMMLKSLYLSLTDPGCNILFAVNTNSHVEYLLDLFRDTIELNPNLDLKRVSRGTIYFKNGSSITFLNVNSKKYDYTLSGQRFKYSFVQNSEFIPLNSLFSVIHHTKDENFLITGTGSLIKYTKDLYYLKTLVYPLSSNPDWRDFDKENIRKAIDNKCWQIEYNCQCPQEEYDKHNNRYGFPRYVSLTSE